MKLAQKRSSEAYQKLIFQPLHDEVKSVLDINGEKVVKKFSNNLQQRISSISASAESAPKQHQQHQHISASAALAHQQHQRISSISILAELVKCTGRDICPYTSINSGHTSLYTLTRLDTTRHASDTTRHHQTGSRHHQTQPDIHQTMVLWVCEASEVNNWTEFKLGPIITRLRRLYIWFTEVIHVKIQKASSWSDRQGSDKN